MQGSEPILDHFFKQNFIEIPLYQRNYDWKEKNCEKLFEDIIDVFRISNDSKSEFRYRTHFFGSIIYMIDQNTDARVVIDGQQRITTLALLLAAVRDGIDEGSIVTSDSKLQDKLDRKLKDQDDGHIFLSLVEKDQPAYEAIVNGEKDRYDLTSNVTINYNYFKKRIQLQEITVDQFVESMEKLYIMYIRLDSMVDDAQMVFESINSTGLNLTEGDKVRNYLLMNHEVKDQKKYYNRYWRRIDDSSFDLSRFFRDYITAVTGKIPRTSEIYLEFKKYTKSLRSSKDTFEGMFEEIVSYSDYYRMIMGPNMDHISKKASMQMYRINYQEATVSYPFMMRLLNANKNDDTLSNKDIEDVLEVLENYMLRRSVCKIPTNALNKIFQNLYETLTKDGTDNFVEKLKYLLLKKEGSSRYPRDMEVMTSLKGMDLYNSNTCPQVLSVIENANRDTTDTLKRSCEKELSIEHVMPQKLSESWKSYLGDEYAQIHETWLHRLGNLTFTAYNSEYSNRPYDEKRKIKDFGFIDSGLRLNRIMKENDIWNENVMKERNEIMTNDFIRFMPEFNSSYVPPPAERNNIDEYTLEEDDETFRRMNIKGYVFDGKRVETKSGVQAYLELLSEIYKIDSVKFKVSAEKIVAGQTIPKLTSDIGSVEGEWDKLDYEKISPDMWANKRLNHDSKAYILKSLIASYDIEPGDVAFIGIKDRDRDLKDTE